MCVYIWTYIYDVSYKREGTKTLMQGDDISTLQLPRNKHEPGFKRVRLFKKRTPSPD